MPRRLVEMLTSLQTHAGLTLHAYTMDRKPGPQDHEAVGNKLCALADKHGWPYLPVLLTTNLKDAGKFIRDVLNQDPDAARKMKLTIEGQENYFLSVFLMPTHSPANQKIMDLH